MLRIACGFMMTTHIFLEYVHDKLIDKMKKEAHSFDLFHFRNKYKIRKRKMTKYGFKLMKIETKLRITKASIIYSMMIFVGERSSRTHNIAFLINEKVEKNNSDMNGGLKK